jgi:hypothetical protein
MSNSLSLPRSPAWPSPIASATAAFSAFSRGSSGSIRLRSASDDAGMAASGSSVDVDTGDDTEDDVDLDYGDVEPEAAPVAQAHHLHQTQGRAVDAARRRLARQQR